MATPTAEGEVAPRTLLDVINVKYSELKQHRCSRLIFSAQLHATASPVDISEFLLSFLEGQSRKPELKVPPDACPTSHVATIEPGITTIEPGITLSFSSLALSGLLVGDVAHHSTVHSLLGRGTHQGAQPAVARIPPARAGL